METKLKKWPWKAWLREALVTALILGAIYMVVRHFQLEAQRGGGGNLTPGVQATLFELQEVRDGKKVSLASLEGRPVVLNFWATWCPTCVAELPNLDRFHQEAKGRYVVLSISSESPYKLRDYIDDEGLQVPVLYDRGGRVSRAYAVAAIPTTVIIDDKGRLVHDFSGGADLDILREHIDRIIASKAQAR